MTHNGPYVARSESAKLAGRPYAATICRLAVADETPGLSRRFFLAAGSLMEFIDEMKRVLTMAL